jgi:tetratricopeptide (TPR) repeat protein
VKKLFLAFSFFCFFNSFSQNDDTLAYFKSLKEAATDEEKIKVNMQLAKHFWAIDNLRSLQYSGAAKELSRAINDKKHLGDALCAEGESNFILQNYNKAEANFTEALITYDKLKTPIGTAEALQGLGKVAYAKNDLGASLTHYGEALKIFERENYKDGLPGLYINLGLLYEDSGNMNQAIEFYKKGLKMSHESKDVVAESSCYMNIGSIFYSQGSFKQAIDFLEKALELNRSVGNKKGMGSALNNLGATYYDMGNIDKALSYFEEAYSVYLSLKDKKSIFPACNNLGSIYHERKEYTKALEYFDQAYAISEGLGSLPKKIVSLENLTLLHRDMKNYEKAVEYSVLCWQLKDTLYNKDQAKINTEMQTRFATEKKQQENELLNLQVKSESLMKTIFIIVTCLMIVIAFFIFRGFRQKHKMNLALEEKNQIIEEQQREVLDSIHYAKRIQQSLLATDKYITRTFERLKSGKKL